MIWSNSQKSQLPEDGQEVFIIVDGINYVAIYDKGENTFTVKDLKNVSFNAETKRVFWSDKRSESA